MIVYVTTGRVLWGLNATLIRDLVFGADPRASATHSGQCTPTAAWVWQAGQMVRPQRWQSTKLCRSGCR